LEKNFNGVNKLEHNKIVVWTKDKPKIPATMIHFDLSSNSNLKKTAQKKSRPWNPFQNSLSAAIICGLEFLPISEKTRNILYVNNSKNTKLEHFLDLTKNNAMITILRKQENNNELLNMKNLEFVNNLQNSNHLKNKFDLIFIDDKNFHLDESMSTVISSLKNDGFLFITLSKESNELLSNSLKKLSESFFLLQEINIENYFDDQIFIVARLDNIKKNKLL